MLAGPTLPNTAKQYHGDDLLALPARRDHNLLPMAPSAPPIYIHQHAFLYVYTHTCAPACISTRTHTHTHTCVHIQIHTKLQLELVQVGRPRVDTLQRCNLYYYFSNVSKSPRDWGGAKPPQASSATAAQLHHFRSWPCLLL